MSGSRPSVVSLHWRHNEPRADLPGGCRLGPGTDDGHWGEIQFVQGCHSVHQRGAGHHIQVAIRFNLADFAEGVGDVKILSGHVGWWHRRETVAAHAFVPAALVRIEVNRDAV